MQKQNSVLSIINRFRRSKFYEVLSVSMMTQYRGIVWSDIKALVLAIIFVRYFPSLYPVLILFALCNIGSTILAFALDLVFDFGVREVKVHKLPRTAKDIRTEHSQYRNIAIALKPRMTAPHTPSVKKSREREEREPVREREQVRDRPQPPMPTDMQRRREELLNASGPGAARARHAATGETIQIS